MQPDGALARRFRLSIWSTSGDVLRTSRDGLSLPRRLNFTVCGQSRLRLLVQPKRRSEPPFPLLIQRP